MLIQVTQEDILLGVRKNPCECPLALAIRRQFPNQDIGVHSDRVINYAQNYKLCLLPQSARTFVRNFDLQKPVEPEVFDLPLEHPKIDFVEYFDPD